MPKNSCWALIGLNFLGLLLVVRFATNIMDRQWDEIGRLYRENRALESALKEETKQVFAVTATMYRPLIQETDSTPHILADGTEIDINTAEDYRFIAVSRDLLKRWGGPFDYGDFVLIEDAGDHSGVFQIRDTMHSKWTLRIDFLMSIDCDPFRYDNVKLSLYGTVTGQSRNT